MLEIITNIQKIPHLKNRFLTATLNIDGYRTDSPIIAKKDDQYYIVSRHLDRGNTEELKKLNLLPYNAEPVYFKPYFAFVPIEPPAEKDFYAAFERIAKGDKVITVQQDMPMHLYEMFSERFEILKEGKTEIPVMYLYKLPRKLVLERFAETREDAVKIAKELMSHSKYKEEVDICLDTTKDERFEILDKMMGEKGIDCLLCTSALGIQEITGFGIDHFVENEAMAVYVAKSDEVYFYNCRLLQGFGREEVIYDVKKHIQELFDNKTVGVEEMHFSVGWFDYFALNKTKCEKAQALTRNFRLVRGAYNLPYYIITSRLGTYAIESTIKWLRDKIGSGEKVSELDVNDMHEANIKEYIKKNKIPFVISKYWTGLHSSDRSVTPSYAFDHNVTVDSKALKLDAGLLLKDNKGILLAVSDIARTISFTDYGEKLFEVLDKIIYENVIPKIKSGLTGEEIYLMTTDSIEEYRSVLEPIGMIPKEKVSEVFNRDVGHGLSLHEPGTLWFEKGDKKAVLEGMVCAHEIQWSTRGFSIGVEDIFLVGKTHGINISRD